MQYFFHGKFSISPSVHVTVLEMRAKPLRIQYKNAPEVLTVFPFMINIMKSVIKVLLVSVRHKNSQHLESKQDNKQRAQYSADVNVLGRLYYFFCVIIRLLKPGKSESAQNFVSTWYIITIIFWVFRFLKFLKEHEKIGNFELKIYITATTFKYL